MTTKIQGVIRSWELFDNKRTFSEVSVPFGVAHSIFKAVRYNAITGKGEQRELHEPHVRKLMKELAAGTFTPTAIGVHLTKKQREKVKVDGDSFELMVDANDPLHQTDGQHRFEAAGRLLAGLREALEGEEDAKTREKLERHIKQLEELPIAVILYLDGDLQTDFVNLQAGRSVDAAHMLSMKIQHKILAEPEFKVAFDAAKHLARLDGSPYQGQIKFDSRGINPLPISTILQKGASDIGTSLVGLARVALSGDKDADWVADIVLTVYKTLKEKAPALLEETKVLATIANGGKRGQATMMIGLATSLAYRVIANGEETPSKKDLEALVNSAKFTLDESVDGNFSGATKRSLLGVFGRDFFAGMKLEYHDGLPKELLEILSPSAFGSIPLPKKTRGKQVEETTETAKAPELEEPKVEATVVSEKKKKKGKKTKEEQQPEPEDVPSESPFSDEVVESDPWDETQG